MRHGERDLTWPDCANVRDLGGLPIAGGGLTRRGAVVRGDAPDRLTAAGWEALVAHGVRTIVDLRNDDELGAGAAPRPAGVATVHVPLDGIEDREFWDQLDDRPEFGTPLYYRPFLGRFPERVARAVTAVARADPGGGVLVHCGRGRDRAGLVSGLLLAVAGVGAEEIAADYALGAEHVADQDQRTVIDAFLAERGSSAREAMLEAFASLDVPAYLRDAGVVQGDLDAVRARLAG
jgi:protein-tyrosine phosphatase